MANNIHVGDWGTKITATITGEDGSIININLATTKELIFKRSDGTIFTKNGVFEAGADGSDGKFHYMTVDGDIDMGGDWSVQPHVIGPDYEYYADPVDVTIDDNLEADPV